MKCPMCCGDGWVLNITCDACNGTGIVAPLTEQEFLQTCNTEQLADVFFEYRYINSTPQQQLWMSASEEYIKMGIVEWLKQPHRNE